MDAYVPKRLRIRDRDDHLTRQQEDNEKGVHMGLIINGEIISDDVLETSYNSDRIRNAYTEHCKSEGIEETDEGRRQFNEDRIIEDTVILQGAKAAVPPPKEHAIKSRLSQLKSDLYLPTDTVTPFEEELRQIAVKKYYLVKFFKLIDSCIPHPTEEECNKYYEEHLDDFAAGEVYRFTHICFSLDNYESQTEATVDLLNLKARIESSQNPDDSWWYAIGKYSITVDQDNGEYPPVKKGKLDPQIEAPLFKCTVPGQISEPIVTSENTIDLFRFEAVRDLGVLPFSTVYPLIRKRVFQEKQAIATGKKLEELKTKAVIEHTPPVQATGETGDAASE